MQGTLCHPPLEYNVHAIVLSAQHSVPRHSKIGKSPQVLFKNVSTSTIRNCIGKNMYEPTPFLDMFQILETLSDWHMISFLERYVVPRCMDKLSCMYNTP